MTASARTRWLRIGLSATEPNPNNQLRRHRAAWRVSPPTITRQTAIEDENVSWKCHEDVSFSELLGKTLVAATMSDDDDEVRFVTDDGTSVRSVS